MCPSRIGGCGATHEASLMWHFTILDCERTYGLSQMVGKHFRFPFPPSFYSKFEKLSTVTVSFLLLLPTLSASLHLLFEPGKPALPHLPAETRYLFLFIPLLLYLHDHLFNMFVLIVLLWIGSLYAHVRCYRYLVSYFRFNLKCISVYDSLSWMYVWMCVSTFVSRYSIWWITEPCTPGPPRTF